MSDVDAQHSRIRQMATEILALPPQQREQLVEMVHDIEVGESGLQQAVIDLRKCLDDLRLTVAYTIFDLEATRRENAMLKQKLARGDKA